MTVGHSSQNSPGLPVPGAIKTDITDAGRFPREFIVFSYFVLLLVLIGFTAFVARLYHKNVHVLADGWFAKGESELQAGNSSAAIIDYRNALAYSPANSVFQLHLAQALTAAGKRDEARSYLLNLLAENPGSGQINLDLARNSKDSMRDAMRYYNGAIYGYWENDPVVMRWDVRYELCQYLLNRATIDQAQPEIIALAQELPPGDLDRQKKAAALLLEVNLWRRALDEYGAILSAHMHDDDALAGAGIAAFHLGEYPRAVAYFDHLPRERRDAQDISSLLATTTDIQAESPFLAELSGPERARRTLRAIAVAEARLENCISQPAGASALPPSSIAQLRELSDRLKSSSANWTQRSLSSDQSQIDAAMSLVFQTENTAAALCSQPQDPADRALLLIGQSETGREQ